MEEYKENLSAETGAAEQAEAPAEVSAAVQAEASAAEQTPAPKKEMTMRRVVNHTFKWLLVYNIFQMIIAGIADSFTKDLGIKMSLGTVLGTGLVFLCTSRRWKVNPFEKRTKKMTLRDFCTIFGVFAITQLITLCVSLITEAAGVQGTSISMGELTVPVILYASLIGPFVEEMIYRGFSIGTMKRKGLIPAIVLSSLAFGLMHGNFSQLVIGALSGLLLGFVFSEYSIWWGVLIHVINNSLGTAIGLFPESQQSIVGYSAYGVFGLFAIFAIIDVIRRKDEVKEWFARPENHMQKGDLKGIFSSVWLWLFAIVYLGITISLMVFPQLAGMMPTK